jgi:hypothetical protein
MRRPGIILVAVTLVTVTVNTATVRPASAAKPDCANNTCVWDQPEYTGKLVTVTSNCLEFPVRSGANTRTSGKSKLRIYLKPGCTGFSIPLENGQSTPNIRGASANVS